MSNDDPAWSSGAIHAGSHNRRNPVVLGHIRVDDMKVASRVHSLLALLPSLISRFEHALSLLDFLDSSIEMAKSEGLPLQARTYYHDWQMVAARDAAVTLNNFQDALRSIRGIAVGCRSLTVDQEELRKAESVLDEALPHLKAVRHAVGHVADSMTKDEHRPEGLLIGALLDGRTLMVARDKGYVEVRLDTSTADCLNSITDLAYRSFSPPSVG